MGPYPYPYAPPPPYPQQRIEVTSPSAHRHHEMNLSRAHALLYYTLLSTLRNFLVKEENGIPDLIQIQAYTIAKHDLCRILDSCLSQIDARELGLTIETSIENTMLCNSNYSHGNSNSYKTKDRKDRSLNIGNSTSSSKRLRKKK